MSFRFKFNPLVLLLCSPALWAQETHQNSAYGVSQMNQGGVGLIQMPTARMATPGDFSVNYRDSDEYRYWSLSLQLFPWLETTVRYTDIRTVLYSDDPGFSGDQTLKDKGIDAKVLLWRESDFLPQISAGIRDFGGTGVFESEFVAASKRLGPIDIHLGLGWGYLGRRGNVTNPFCELKDSFCDRPGGFGGQGGQVEYKSFFHGPASLYGGIEYQTPWTPLRLKLEYDGNNYKTDIAGVLPVDSAWNAAVNYNVSDNLDFTLNYQRGNTIGFGASYKFNLNTASQIKVGPAPRPVPPATTVIEQEPGQAYLAQQLLEAGFIVKKYSLGPNTAFVMGNQISYRDSVEATDRVSRILANNLPDRIKTYRIVEVKGDLPLVETVVDVEKFKSAARYESLKVTTSDAMDRVNPPAEPVTDNVRFRVDSTGFFSNLETFWLQSFGGPESFYMYQFGALVGGGYVFTDELALHTNLKVNVLENFDKFKYTVDAYESPVPRVRTYVREYVTRSRTTLENAFLHYNTYIGGNWYAQAYAGYLETMYGGVGTEILHRPLDSNWAFGVDLNYVKQRSYEEEFKFMDYKVLTGHANIYWQPQYEFLDDTLLTFKIGRYLAKDKGMTIDFAKRFDSGIVIGAFATKTNVSSADYGEGSFSKGFYMSIPFDLFSIKNSVGRGRLPWVPISRDGGQPLNRPIQLFDMTERRSPFLR